MSVLVRRRSLNHGHVHRNHAPAQQVRDLRQGYGDVVRQARVHGLPGALPHKERRVPEVPLKPLVGVRGRPDGPQMHHLDIEEGLGMSLHVLREGADEVLGLPAAGADEQPTAAVDMSEDLLFRGELPRVPLFELGQSTGAVLPHVLTHPGILSQLLRVRRGDRFSGYRYVPQATADVAYITRHMPLALAPVAGHPLHSRPSSKPVCQRVSRAATPIVPLVCPDLSALKAIGRLIRYRGS